MLEENAAALADGDPTGRAIRDEHYVGGNLGAQAQAVEGIGPGGRDAYAVSCCDGLCNLVYGGEDSAATPAFIDAGITIYTLRYARENAVFAQADEGRAYSIGGACIGKGIGEEQGTSPRLFYAVLDGIVCALVCHNTSFATNI